MKILQHLFAFQFFGKERKYNKNFFFFFCHSMHNKTFTLKTIVKCKFIHLKIVSSYIKFKIYLFQFIFFLLNKIIYINLNLIYKMKVLVFL